MMWVGFWVGWGLLMIFWNDLVVNFLIWEVVVGLWRSDLGDIMMSGLWKLCFIWWWSV